MNEKADLDTLFAFVMRYARAWMGEHGEFAPFAATMDRAGQCELLFAAAHGLDARPVREILTEGLQAKAAERTCRGAALCLDVELRLDGDLTDALFVYLEHEAGMALQVVTPYVRQGGALVYGKTRASRGVPNTFFPARSVH